MNGNLLRNRWQRLPERVVRQAQAEQLSHYLRTAVLPFKRRLKIGHSLSSMCHSWSLAECGQPNADSSFSNFTLAANSQRLWPHPR